MENKPPAVSVIIPTFNRAELLRRTIKSILEQTFTDFEIILVDDGSNDETNQVVSNFNDSRIKYNYIKSTKDIAKVRNFGLRMAKGDYIAFCDDDDLWMNDKLEKQLRYVNEYKFICTASNLIDINDKLIDDTRNKKIKGVQIFSIRDLLIANFIITSSVLLKKSELLHGFVESNSTNSAEDYELWLRVALKNKILKIEEPLVLFRKHSNTSTFDNGTKYIGILKSVLKILSRYTNNYDLDISRYAKYSIVRQRWELIKVLYSNHHIKDALANCLKLIVKLFNVNVLFMFYKRKFLSNTLINNLYAF